MISSYLNYFQVPQVQGQVHRLGPGVQGSGGGKPEGQGRNAADSGGQNHETYVDQLKHIESCVMG